MVLRECVLISLLFSSIYGDDFDIDYYLSPGLRYGLKSCKGRLSQFLCQMKCNLKPAICIENKCYCISMSPVKEKSDVKIILLRNKKLQNKNLIEELGDFEQLKQPEIPPIELEALFALRPTLRHHIAHFCPNLDVARACIRKCMAQGKPAFCGKDHVCYCGHKYTHTAKDDGGDVKEIYAQFKDLYEKYFPNYNPTLDTTIDPTNDKKRDLTPDPFDPYEGIKSVELY